ncbi:MAG: hypothetical protein R2822_22565 [Spirosomataceae bacterium]
MENNLSIKNTIEKDKNFPFRPNQEFYEATGINRKRWGLIYAGKLEPTVTEVDRISKYLGIPVISFFQ